MNPQKIKRSEFLRLYHSRTNNSSSQLEENYNKAIEERGLSRISETIEQEKKNREQIESHE